MPMQEVNGPCHVTTGLWWNGIDGEGSTVSRYSDTSKGYMAINGIRNTLSMGQEWN